MDRLPLFQALASSKRILLAGAGGGYDVFSGLPLYFKLKRLGHQVFLANFSFAPLQSKHAIREDLPLVYTTSEIEGPAYFPEKYLCQWLNAYDEAPTTLYTFMRSGVVPIRRAYEHLVTELSLDAVVLVDGGTDSLMRGDEHGLGTPAEDLTSVAAVSGLEVPTKLLVCIGFGVDVFHGVCHHYFLEAVADLTRGGHYLGAFSLMAEHEEAYKLKQAAEYVFSKMPFHVSIVLTSILSATLGRFGDHHATERTQGSKLYINPLMSLYWSFHLEGVAKRCLYLDRLVDTQTAGEVTQAIRAFRDESFKRPWKNMPV